MPIITARFTQYATLVFKINVSCITKQQIVYKPVDVPSSGSRCASKSVPCSVSWADALRVQQSAHGREVCEYLYPAGKLTISRLWLPEVLTVEAGGVLGRGGVGSGVGSGLYCLRRLGGGSPVHVHLQRVCGFLPVPFSNERHLGV